MRVVLELFLFDNLLMNALILRAAQALSGAAPRRFGIMAASCLGTAYAAAALGIGGAWLLFPVKLGVSAAMVFIAFRLRDRRRFIKAAVCFYIATFIIGGMCFALVSMMGGYADGFILGVSAPVRALLCGAALAAFLPRWIRAFLAKRRTNEKIALLRVSIRDKDVELSALLDTGSALVEPFSGRPVMLVTPEKGLMISRDTPGARPVPYSSISEEGLLFAVKPEKTETLMQGKWQPAPTVFVANSPMPLKGVDAIVSDEWWQSFN